MVKRLIRLWLHYDVALFPTVDSGGQRLLFIHYWSLILRLSHSLV